MNDLGPGPLLSSEETDALLSAMQAPAEPMADPVDLAAPDRYIHSVLPRADRMGAELRTGVTNCMRRYLGCQVQVVDDPSEISSAAVTTTGVEPGTAVAILRTPAGHVGLLTIAPALTTMLLERRLGAPVDAEGPQRPQTDRLSKVDARVLLPVSRTLLSALSTPFCDLPDRLSVQSIAMGPEDMPRIPPTEPMLSVSLRVDAGSASGATIRYLLTPGAVRDSIGVEEQDVPVVAPSRTEQRLWASNLPTTRVSAVAVLGHASASVRELLSLKVGSVLRLDTVPGDAVVIRVGDAAVLQGQPVVHHGNLAVAVTAGGNPAPMERA